MNPEDQVAALATRGLEDDVKEMDVKATARRTMLDALPDALDTITELALLSGNPNVRLKAATYIADRVLGPVGKVGSNGESDPLAEMIAKLQDAGNQPR